MSNRDSLHALVDTLPDEAVGMIERILQHHQKWPPRTRLDARRLHEQLKDRFLGYAREHPPHPGKGQTVSLMGGGHGSPEGDASASMSGWEGDTSVTVEHRLFRGHRLEIETRVHVSNDKKSLFYSQMIKGPGGRENTHEVEFDLGEGRQDSV